MPGYDMDLDMKVKAVGNDLFDRLRALSGLEAVESHRFAVRACRDALGVLPIGDGLDGLSDTQVRALLPKVEAARAAAAILTAVLDQRGR